MGYKGFIQLAQRSGQYKLINAVDVREGELIGKNLLTGELVFKWIQDEEEREKLPVIGYVSYFELLNGFSKMWSFFDAWIAGNEKMLDCRKFGTAQVNRAYKDGYNAGSDAARDAVE